MITKYVVQVDNREYDVQCHDTGGLYPIPITLPSHFRIGIKPSYRKVTLCAAASISWISSDSKHMAFFDLYAVKWRNANYLVLLANTKEAVWHRYERVEIALPDDAIDFAIKQCWPTSESIIIKSRQTLF